jgi:hypothetical protein
MSLDRVCHLTLMCFKHYYNLEICQVDWFQKIIFWLFLKLLKGVTITQRFFNFLLIRAVSTVGFLALTNQIRQILCGKPAPFLNLLSNGFNIRTR